MSRPDVSAIVLAGGRSSRFGRDKLAEALDGRTLLDRSIAAVRLVAAEIVVVTAIEDRRSLPDDVIVVHDSMAFEGPLVGLLTGLRQATAPRAIVAAGDMPTMVRDVLQALLAGLDDASFDAVILEGDGRPRPLPAAVRTGAALAAAGRLVAAGERRLRALFDQLACQAIDEPTWRAVDPDGQTLRDVDVPEDLR